MGAHPVRRHVPQHCILQEGSPRTPPPPALVITPPPLGGGSVPWPRKHRKYYAPKACLQGAEADVHCDTVVQFCGATPPPPGTIVSPPPPPQGGGGGASRHWWGDYKGGGGYGHFLRPHSRCWGSLGEVSRGGAPPPRTWRCPPPWPAHACSAMGTPLAAQDGPRGSTWPVQSLRLTGGGAYTISFVRPPPLAFLTVPQGTWGAYRALCPRCAKKRLFSTAGSHGSQDPESCTPDAVLNGSCTLL